MNTAHEEVTTSRAIHLSRQQQRRAARRLTKRLPLYLLPSRWTESAFLTRLDRRPLAYLGRQQTRLKRLLANCDRLVSEHGGEKHVVGRLVAADRAVWERQLALVQGLIVKRTRTPARRDARPRRIQRLAKVG